MKIYDVANFPNPIRVRIALAEKNATDNVEFINVDVANGEHRKDAFIAKNPSAAVPLLELDDGTCISECPAITEYIDHTFEGPSLTGETPKERAVISMMQRRAETMILDAVSAYFHHATEGLGPVLEVYQNEDWGLKQRERALNGMVYFNKVLSDSEFVAGDDFTIADITLFAGLAFADFAGVETPVECSNLLLWKAKVGARPSVNG
jgi:glutathione S-transferase